MHSRGGFNPGVRTQIRAAIAGPDLIGSAVVDYNLPGLHAFCAEKLHLFFLAVPQRDRSWMSIDVILIQLFGSKVDVRPGYVRAFSCTLLGNRGLGAWPHFEEYPGDEFKARLLEALSGFVVDGHP